jgi:hypothetical protein
MKHSVIMIPVVAIVASLGIAFGEAAAQQPAGERPASLEGSYALAAPEDGELPILLREKGDCRIEITAAELSLHDENRWRLSATVRETCGDDAEVRTVTQEGEFTADGDALQFEHAAAEPAEQEEEAAKSDLEEIRAATLAQDEIKITLARDNRVLVFRR